MPPGINYRYTPTYVLVESHGASLKYAPCANALARVARAPSYFESPAPTACTFIDTQLARISRVTLKVAIWRSVIVSLLFSVGVFTSRTPASNGHSDRVHVFTLGAEARDEPMTQMSDCTCASESNHERRRRIEEIA
ncbi:uncharacterized protein LOC143187234 [Calliopsis andreniformis]|uniref:uncharacterized protein LOC143187234 n=1 Tax=Calliopsis andreniformis TaxID=337506 RepID=UPI003FCCFA96